MDLYVGKSSLLISKGSVFDLATVYTMLFVCRKVTEKEWEDITHKFSVVLDKGFTFHEVLSIMFSYMNSIPKRQLRILDILKHRSSQSNMIKQNTMYYHKELRVQPEPSVTNIDYNTGIMVSSGQKFFVELVASYTMNDLVKYLLSFGYIDTIEYPINRIKGLLKFYLGKYDIDTVLFMMEAVLDTLESKERFDFAKFDSYYYTGSNYLSNIKNNCRSTGGDKIAPRERILF